MVSSLVVCLVGAVVSDGIPVGTDALQKFVEEMFVLGMLLSVFETEVSKVVFTKPPVVMVPSGKGSSVTGNKVLMVWQSVPSHVLDLISSTVVGSSSVMLVAVSVLV